VGHMNGKHIESTMTFTAMTYTRLTLDNGWWLNFNPIYTVSLDNSSISDLSMEVFASKQITPTFNARLKFDSSNDNLSFELNKAF
nr:hypothetical protein [Endozoicomonas sp.]